MHSHDFSWLLSLFLRRQPRRKSKVRRPTHRLLPLEPLEPRLLLAADLRAIDGSGNNVAHPQWGSTDEDFLRKAAAQYGNGISTPAGATRPSARAISNAIASQSDEILNSRDMSAFVYAWGQFVDHDIDLTESSTDAAASLPIAVPTGDPYFDPSGTGTQTIDFTRSAYDPLTGTSKKNPRQQVNQITAFLDGSMVYGSDAERAAALRSFNGGRLKTSQGDLLPLNDMGLENGTSPVAPANEFFVAGDVRANENPELTSIQTLFMREHNRVAGQLALRHSDWTDEQLYQQARRIVVAEIQAITYNEFLPALLGDGALQPYRGYNPAVNPGISNEFATAAFRLGHSLVGFDIEFLDDQGQPVQDEMELRDAFFNPNVLKETGIDPILKYLASDRAQELDTRVVDDLRNFLFGPPGSGGFDLASLNIQRGRDHGLADYNTVRVAYGLKPVRSFSEITSDPGLQKALQDTYHSVNNVDLWVGGLAEDHLPGSSLGPIFQRILIDQFQRLRDGDRFWYERDFQGNQLSQLRNTTLADVIRRNTGLTNLQDDVFFFQVEVSGRVLAAGSAGQKVLGLAGVVVQLQDSSGNLIASTITKGDGSYRFEQLDLGVYRVRLALTAGMLQTSVDPADVTFTRGDQTGRLNFSVRTVSSNPPGSWHERGMVPLTVTDTTGGLGPSDLTLPNKPQQGRK